MPVTAEVKLAGKKIILCKGGKQPNAVNPSEYIRVVGSLLFLSSWHDFLSPVNCTERFGDRHCCAVLDVYIK